MMPGKCPQCGTAVHSLAVNGVETREMLSTKVWKAITLSCPGCNAVLGAQIDPIAIKTDIVNELLARLRKP